MNFTAKPEFIKDNIEEKDVAILYIMQRSKGESLKAYNLYGNRQEYWVREAHRILDKFREAHGDLIFSERALYGTDYVKYKHSKSTIPYALEISIYKDDENTYRRDKTGEIYTVEVEPHDIYGLIICNRCEGTGSDASNSYSWGMCFMCNHECTDYTMNYSVYPSSTSYNL